MTADPPFSSRPGRRRGKRRLALLLLVTLSVPTVIASFPDRRAPAPAQPPWAIEAGADLGVLQARGWAGPLDLDAASGAFTLPLHLPAGARVTVDGLLTLHLERSVETVSMTPADSQGLREAPIATLRLWTGDQPPGGDDDPQVCQVVDLRAAYGTSRDRCLTGPVHVQLILELPEGVADPVAFRVTTAATLVN